MKSYAVRVVCAPEPIDKTPVYETARAAWRESASLEIQRRRCEDDPLYALLVYPRSLMQIKDPETSLVTECEYQHRLLKDMLDHIYQRYGPKVAKDPYLRQQFDWLLSGAATLEIRMFAILVLLTYQPEFASVIQRMYGPNGFRGPEDFCRAIETLPGLVESAANEPIGRLSITRWVRGLIENVIRRYLGSGAHNADLPSNSHPEVESMPT